ncbi:two-component system, OmpR family, phosphate regulon sensor histidine kinase PhoR [Desulfurobacterium pacificum]|uniref:histidine kinase n=1 Tax=Desulfurobacterium pacificum TaxID=240166 RepID=A0ABY1NEI5_9BACT|nr:HAMP domain-containing sensor histidine kinase [Desulfurobacterium pacificum]SMP07260.1 two-component system, OmpR family, phosphate regulon sensor histidine kinase PhoR [Desulfurobacterium pacificum]
MKFEELLKLVNEKTGDVLFVDGKGEIFGTEERLWDRFPFSEVVKGFEDAKSAGKGYFEVEEGGRIFEFKIERVLDGVFLVLRRDVTCARRIHKIKKDILSTVSHEIKTPLTVVKGNLDFLLAYRNLCAEDREIVEESLENVGKIENIVRSLRKLFLEESGGEVVDLKTVVEGVIRNYRKKFEEKGLKIKLFLESAYVRCERILFEQLVKNLIDNAVRFTDRGEINVTLKMGENGVVFSVRDTGRGIPEELQRMVFEKYVKSPDSEGQGIGLSVVKEIVKFHDWKISLSSEVNKGTEVKVIIPTSSTF